MNFADLQNKSENELKEVLAKLETELHGLHFAMKTKQIKQVHEFGLKRKNIAQIKMLLANRAK